MKKQLAILESGYRPTLEALYANYISEWQALTNCNYLDRFKALNAKYEAKLAPLRSDYAAQRSHLGRETGA